LLAPVELGKEHEGLPEGLRNPPSAALDFPNPRSPAVAFRAENNFMLECSRRHPPRCSSLLMILMLSFLCTSASVRGAEKAINRHGHPIVPGFERFHASGADAVKGGRLLLSELNCVSCHKPDAGQEAWLRRKQAPILDSVGGRVRRSYFRKFL